MPQATCRSRVLWILHVRAHEGAREIHNRWMLYVRAHEGAREIHNRSPTCKGLQFARNRSIIIYCYYLHLILALIFSWMFYLQDQWKTHKGPLHEQQLLYVVDDLCRFILHDVVHIDGYFVHPEHELSTDSKYRSLCQWDNQQLRAGNSSISQKK